MRARPIEGLFAPGVVVLTAEVRDEALDALSAREAESLGRAGAKRRREFATGRALARQALERLGVRDFDLLNGEDRAPRWPEGVTGSISHSDRRAVVAVGPAAVGTVGVDVEHRQGLPERLWRMTMLPAEQELLLRHPEAERERWALLIFSAKEALYKAQYPWSKTYMGFFALRVGLEPDPEAPLSRGALRCVFQQDVPPFCEGAVIGGRYVPLDVEPQTVVAGVHVRPGDAG